jgi:hypothetical protein
MDFLDADKKLGLFQKLREHTQSGAVKWFGTSMNPYSFTTSFGRFELELYCRDGDDEPPFVLTLTPTIPTRGVQQMLETVITPQDEGDGPANTALQLLYRDVKGQSLQVGSVVEDLLEDLDALSQDDSS